MSLDGNRVVVLGGSSGIGLATAQAAAREGASVVIASSRRVRVDEALAVLPAGAEGHALDLTEAAAVEALFERIGTFDHLVFTAGKTLMLGSLAGTDIAAAQRFFALRYWGASRRPNSAARTFGPAARSPLRPTPRAGWSLGASICSAVEGLTRALAVELAPLRVNAVAPGLVETPLWAGMAAADREGFYDGAAAHLPVAHTGEAVEIAESYLYLMRQSYGTGQVLVVDGGGSLV